MYGRGQSSRPPTRERRKPGQSTGHSTGIQNRNISTRDSVAGSGVRYITVDLIRKVSQQDSLSSIVTLNLTLSKEAGKKIKYIEHLDSLKNLQVLNLSYNTIEKIEKLGMLTKLRELNLSFNCISKIESIEHLPQLQVFNVTGNQIEHIPTWLPKKLKSLRVLLLSKNNIKSLSEFSKLRTLPDLTQISVSENPVTDLPHARLFLVFHLRTLNILDGQLVSGEERAEAQNRFNQDEVDRLFKNLEETESRLHNLQDEHNKSVNEIQDRQDYEDEQQVKEKDLSEKIQDLEQELETKTDLLKRKTSELTKACEKHYELEQELAFYKIDAKFDGLGKIPTPDMGDADDNGLFGESPYIGRARFKQNKFAYEHSVPDKAQGIQMTTLGYSDDPRATRMNQEVKQQLHQALDVDLQSKQHEVERAQDRLHKLQNDLEYTEQQVLRATHELQRVTTSMPQQQLTDEDRSELTKKIITVNELREEATRLEDAMTQTQASVQQQETDLDELHKKLQRLDSQESLYGRVKAEMSDKEQQLHLNSEAYDELRNQLDEVLNELAKETANIKALEKRLKEGQIAQNEEIKNELENVVAGLQAYLNDVKTKANRQQHEFDAVLEERDDLKARLQDLEGEMSLLDHEAGDYHKMAQRLRELEDSLNEQQHLNRTLKDKLDQSMQVSPQKDHQLGQSRDKIDHLTKTIEEMKRRAKENTDTLNQALQAERKRFEDLARQLEDTGRNKDDIQSLGAQLAASKAAQESLKAQLKHQQMTDQLNQSVSPDELHRRLQELLDQLEAGQGEIQPSNDGDDVGRMMQDLQQHFRNMLNQTEIDVDDARRKQAKSEGKIGQLQDQIRQLKLQMKSKKHPSKSQQTQMYDSGRESDSEVERLRGEVARLQGVLKQIPTKPANGIPSHFFHPTPHTNTSSEKQRDDSLNSEEQGILEQLQHELRDLRRSMNDTDRLSTKKLTDAQNQVAALQEELRRRNAPPQTLRSDPRLIQAQTELTRAHDDLDDLQKLLEEKDAQLQHAMSQTNRSNQEIEAHQEELRYLHSLLDAQRAEIQRLNDLLNELLTNQSGTPKDNEDLKLLSDEISNLRNELRTVKPKFQPSGQQRPRHRPQQERPFVIKLPQPSSGRQDMPLPRTVPPPASMDRPVNFDPYQPHFAQSKHPGKRAPIGGEGTGSFPSPGRYYSPINSYDNHQPAEDGHHPGGHPVGGYGSTPKQQRSAPPPGFQSPPPGFDVQAGQEMLFCNVPEHHELEDYVSEIQDKVSELQETLKHREDYIVQMQDQVSKLEEKLNEQKLKLKNSKAEADEIAFRRLKEELEKRRDELESLDLAIEKQKAALNRMAATERRLEADKQEALEELEQLRDTNARSQARRDFLKGHLKTEADDGDYEYDYDPRPLKSRGRYLSDEITCLEETLAKRRAELREADRILHECEADLHEARDQARGTIKNYDSAQLELTKTVRDAEEVERRSREAGVELVKAQEHIGELHDEIRQLDAEKSKKESVLQDVNKIIATKDAEFRALDIQNKELTERLCNMENDISLAEDREQEALRGLKDAEDLLANRRTELGRIKTQIEAEKSDLHKMDHEAGKFKAELTLLKESIDSKRGDLSKVLKEAEVDIITKQKQIKELKEQIRGLYHEHEGLLQDIESKEVQLITLKEDVSENKELLVETESATKKQKAELKHVLEMLTLEQRELDDITLKHQQRLVDLERVQKILQEEKSDVDILKIENKKKSSELENLRQIANKLKQDAEILISERQRLEENVSILGQEKEILGSKVNKQEDKVASFERKHSELEISVSEKTNQLHILEDRVASLDKELNKESQKRSELHKEVKALDHQMKEKKIELKTLKEDVTDTQVQVQLFEKDLKDLTHQKNEMAMELQQLAESLKQHRVMSDQAMDEYRLKRDKMKETGKDLLLKEEQCQQAQQVLNQVKREIEKEETKLRQLTQKGKVELDNINSDMSIKREEFSKLRRECDTVKRDMEKQEHDEEKFREMESRYKTLEQQLLESQENREELENIIEHNEHCRAHLQQQLTHLASQKQHLIQELYDLQARSSKSMTELDRVAEEYKHRANRLDDELNALRKEYIQCKEQLMEEADVLEKEKKLDKTLQDIKDDLEAKVDAGLDDLDKSRNEIFDEVEDLHAQREELVHHLENLNDNLNIIRYGESIPSPPKVTIETWKKDAMKDRVQQQQNQLKLQLHEQMSRHVEVIQNARQKSEGTLDSLRRKLTNLEDVLSSSQTDAPSIRHPVVRTRSRSPSRHSSHSQETYRPRRSSRSPLRYTDQIPERGPISPLRRSTSQKYTEEKIQNFMESIRRLKTETLAEIERASSAMTGDI